MTVKKDVAGGAGNKLAATTGRYIVLFKPGRVEDGLDHLEQHAGLHTGAVSFSMEAGGPDPSAASQVFAQLGAGVMSVDPDAAGAIDTSGDSPIQAIVPEEVFELPRFFDEPDVPKAFDPTIFQDSLGETWARLAMNAAGTALTGKGVRVAVLDTGMTFDHPDFAGRAIEKKSFVPGIASAADDHGHGTFCAGLVAGPAAPQEGPRYGIAPDVLLHVGKIADSTGRAPESQILAGLEWALSKQCRVVSLSMGAPAGDTLDPKYEEIGKRALQQGCLIVAAAGNDSARTATIVPVRKPACARPILAVAALAVVSIDYKTLRVAIDSNGGIHPDGGAVDFAAPGMRVRSSWKQPLLYTYGSGTSVATPCIAGAAALLAEASPAATASDLWAALEHSARISTTALARDVGKGLVVFG